MGNTSFSFDNDAFGCIFPFYVELNERLEIVSYGKSIKKLFTSGDFNNFTACFTINRPATYTVSFVALNQLVGQLVVLRANNPAATVLRGQFQTAEPSGNLLFLGSPWLDTPDKLLMNNLSLNDFAAHDPLIDLIHLIKSHQLVNDDLQHLLAKLNSQRDDLKAAAQQLQDMALFSLQSPDPIFRVRDDGTILVSNPAAEKLASFIYEGVEYKIDVFWRALAAKSILTKDYYTFEVQSGGKLFSFLCRAIPHLSSCDVFGRDITQNKETEEENRILSNIAQSNINSVVLTNKKGQINWVNKSFTEITGYTLEEAMGKKPGHLLQGPESNAQTVAYMREQIANAKPFNAEIINYRKQGRPYWARIQGQPIFNTEGAHTGFFAVEEDITSEKNVQEQMKEFEARYRLALEKTGDSVWEHDFATGVTFFSRPIGDFLGYDVDDATDIARLWWDSVHKEDVRLLADANVKYVSGEADSHSMEYRIVRNDGGVKWILDRGVVIAWDTNGKPAKVIGTHTDITKIKQTEVELKERVGQFKSFSENIPGVIYEYEFRKDGSEGFRYMSPSLERLFGIKAHNFSNYTSCINFADRRRIAEINNECKKELTPFYAEAKLTTPAGVEKWHSIQSSFSYISQDGAIVYTGVIMDITARKNAENVLRANEEKYRGIIANMNLGLLEVDNEEKITYANQSFCQMSGYTVHELLGKVAQPLFTNGDHGQLLQRKNILRKTGLSDAYELQIRDKNGAKKWWLVSAAPKYNDSGAIVGSIGINLDITKQKELEAELVEAREHAERLARTKETFLANMSHEIRTPMNAIMGMTAQLSKTSLAERQKFYLDTIQTATDNLLVIINDILDLSKIEAGKLIIENIGFEPKKLVIKAINTLAHKAEEKGIALKNSFFDEYIANVLIGDPVRLNQILLNLLSNAIEFTEKGGVNVLVKLGQNLSNIQEIIVEVRDTGVGMDEAFLEHLFDKFSQENESVARLYGGTGLAMSICRQLVDLMGGRIKATSKKGEGTMICFAVKLGKGTEADLPAKHEVSQGLDYLRNKKVLVVDDNKLNRIVAAAVMLNHGILVTEAEGGAEALAALAQDSFDVVLMDIQMPGMDGYDTTLAIRTRGIKVPIVAFTAKAIKGEREKCLAAGMDDYVAKPFREEELLRVFAKLMGPCAQVPAEADTVSAIEKSAPLYNTSALNEFGRGNAKFVQKMIGVFCAEAPAMVQAMATAHRQGHLEQMGAIAHKLKPNIDYMGIVSLKDVIREIERLGNENTNSQKLPQMLKSVEDVINNVTLQLQVP